MAHGEPLAPRSAGQRRHRKKKHSRRLLLGMIASCGIGVGAIAGSATIGSMKGQGPSLATPISTPWLSDEETGSRLASEVDRGRGWASMAFLAGLRNCPDPSPAFLQGCQARMAEEEASARALAAWRAENEDQYAAATETFDYVYREADYPEPREAGWTAMRHASVDELEQTGMRCTGACQADASDLTAPEEAAGIDATVAQPAWHSLAAPAPHAEQAQPIVQTAASIPAPIAQ